MLHDKIQVYGDLRTADSKAARVLMQKEQHRQTLAIKKAIEEQRPICLPGDRIENYGDPEDADYVAPLELPYIMNVTEIVQRKLDEEEDIGRELKEMQAQAAFGFANNFRMMQEDSRGVSGNLESLTSIGQVGSANPNRSLIDAKKSIGAAKMLQDELKAGEGQDGVMSTLMAIEAGKPIPKLALGSGAEREERNEDEVNLNIQLIERHSFLCRSQRLEF